MDSESRSRKNRGRCSVPAGHTPFCQDHSGRLARPLLFRDSGMSSTQIAPIAPAGLTNRTRRTGPEQATYKPRLRTLLSLPLTILAAFPIHLAMVEKQTAPESRAYSIFLGILLSVALVCLSVQSFSDGFRGWLAHMFPIIAAGVVTL